MTPPTPPLIVPLNAAGATLETVGGKGLNLAKLAQAGFPVPGGFLITTRAYDAFVRATDLSDWIAQEVAATDTADPDGLAALSQRIRRRFRQSPVPDAIAQPIQQAYARLVQRKVAVRSSATAEDLPDLSFAGQQDTILNVQGGDALLAAVVDCWSSLWTARAIGYRARNGIDQSAVSLAVVVQEMVQSETSGVLFTANPLTGRRTETVIDATFGLGEALVSGQVEPDHYVVETQTGRILHKQLGAKATVIHGLAQGGTETRQENRASEKALTDRQIRELTGLGRRVANFYQTPQDIEWAFAGGRLYLLQSRPVTSLFPLPSAGDSRELQVFFSFGAVQGVLDPLTPLGRDVIRGIMAGGARLFGFQFTHRTQPVIFEAGERLWVNLTGALRHPIGRRILSRAFPLIEPGAAQSMEALMADSRLSAGSLSWETLRHRVRPLATRVGQAVLAAWRQPETSAARARAAADEFVAEFARQAETRRSLAQRVALCEEMAYNAFPFALPQFVPSVLIGYISLATLNAVARELAKTDGEITPQTALDLTRGLPQNVTTEMDLALWRTAQRIRQDEAAAAAFRRGDADALAEAYLAGELAEPVQTALADFLAQYGMRGLAEIDFGRPRWRERPAAIIRSLQSYLAIEDETAAPDAVFRRGEAAAAQATERLAQALLRRPNPTGARLVRALARRVRALAGQRESPKFTIVRLMGIAREALLDSGRALVADGVLERPDDLFFLQLDELKVLAMDAPGDWKRLVQARREAYARELRRQPIPRLLLSDGTAIFEGTTSTPAEAGSGVIAGSGVSPGVVEGTVRVVFDPYDAQLQPGEILVCPGTDPAWTPLFLAAGGLVMEVGGMMTHGSVVAREYGIPAVVGVDRATERLTTGQRVRVDGSAGRVEIVSVGDG